MTASLFICLKKHFIICCYNNRWNLIIYICTVSKKVLSIFLLASVRVTVDGGANRWFHFLQGTDCIAPELITGDMDSVQQSVFTYFTSKGAEVIPTPDQNETDFTKALRHIQRYITSKNLQVLEYVSLLSDTGVSEKVF